MVMMSFAIVGLNLYHQCLSMIRVVDSEAQWLTEAECWKHSMSFEKKRLTATIFVVLITLKQVDVDIGSLTYYYHILAAGLNGYMETVINLKSLSNKRQCGAAPMIAMMTVKHYGRGSRSEPVAPNTLHYMDLQHIEAMVQDTSALGTISNIEALNILLENKVVVHLKSPQHSGIFQCLKSRKLYTSLFRTNGCVPHQMVILDLV